MELQINCSYTPSQQILGQHCFCYLVTCYARNSTSFRYNRPALSGLIGTASHPVMRKIRITGFFFECRLH